MVALALPWPETWFAPSCFHFSRTALEARYSGRGILAVASYSVNKKAIAHARRLIEAPQYVLESDWGEGSASSG
jgi:hypothetical protein